MITTVGQMSTGFGASQATAYQAEIQIILTDKSERSESTDVFAAKMKRELQENFVGVEFKSIPVGIMGAQNAPLELVVTGNDIEQVYKQADKLKTMLQKIPGAIDVKLSSEDGSPEINVQVDRDKMAALGLNLATVGQTMQTAFSGNRDGKFRDGEYEYDINIQFNDFDRRTIDDVRNMTFTNPQGHNIRLTQFANVEMSSGPSFLERRDKAPSVKVQAQVVGRPVGDVAAQWQTQFDAEKKPVGMKYIWSGDMENQEEGFGTMLIALAASVILVYLLMVTLYDSFVHPFVVLFSVPLSLIGALLILAMTGNSLNIFTILGIIMLIGLVAKNAILLVDFTNSRIAEGETTYQALIDANHARLRPIMMTTIAMVFGMLPIALAKGAAAEMNNGLAWVIIGGLISSLFLTLVVVPVVYSLFDSVMNRIFKGKKIDYEAEMKADYTPIESEKY